MISNALVEVSHTGNILVLDGKAPCKITGWLMDVALISPRKDSKEGESLGLLIVSRALRSLLGYKMR